MVSAKSHQLLQIKSIWPVIALGEPTRPIWLSHGCMSLMMLAQECQNWQDIWQDIFVRLWWICHAKNVKRHKLQYFWVCGSCWNFCQHCHLIVACPWWCPALFFSSPETNRQDIFVCCEFVMKKCKERQTAILPTVGASATTAIWLLHIPDDLWQWTRRDSKEWLPICTAADCYFNSDVQEWVVTFTWTHDYGLVRAIEDWMI